MVPFFDSMPTKFTIWYRNNMKPEWGIMNTDIWFDVGIPASTFDVAPQLLQYAEFVRSNMLDSTELLAASYVGDQQQLQSGTLPPSWVSWSLGRDRFGDIPTVGEPLYMRAMLFAQQRKLGRHGHVLFHGAVNEAAVGRSLRGCSVMLDYRQRRQLIENSNLSYNREMWSGMRVRAAGGSSVLSVVWEPVLSMYPAQVSEMHAATRWRRKLQGAAVGLFGKVFPVLVGASRVLYSYDEWKGINAGFVPRSVWDDLVRTCSMCTAIAGEFDSAEQYIKDKNENGEFEIYPRYGFAWADIKARWKHYDQYAQDQIMELRNVYFPGAHGGSQSAPSYIDSDPYYDLLAQIFKEVANSLEMDWFNPQLYSGQVENDVAGQFPDSIELNW